MNAAYCMILATLACGAAHAVVLPPPPTPGSAMVKIQGGLNKEESDRAKRAHHHKFHHGKDHTRDDTIFGEPTSAPANADPGVSPIVLAPARPSAAVQAAPCVPAPVVSSTTAPRAGDIAAATARPGDRATGKTAAPVQQQPTAVVCDVSKPIATPAKPVPADPKKSSIQKSPATTVAPGKNS